MKLTEIHRIPLNDDRQEKAVRFQSRQALHGLQLNQIKAAASPIRKVSSSSNHEAIGSSGPVTQQLGHGKSIDLDEDGGLLAVVQGASMTPMKRVPILANFEEWMKMATDNKINATNSWNFALIDYFHDMSLLKEGDGVNFQNSSGTLDGGAKIYTSRVDSVATETGKLLSGLAESGSRKQKQAEGHESDEEEEDLEGEDGTRKKSKRKAGLNRTFQVIFADDVQATRSSEATLAQSFQSLQLKKFELEFTVDPLFKKASADFDEGGAKGLLLNHLTIDTQGKIVFDSSDDTGEEFASGEEIETTYEDGEVLAQDQARKGQDRETGTANVDLGALKSKFFPDLDLLNSQDLCPSLSNFDLGDPKTSLDIPYLKDPDPAVPDSVDQRTQHIGETEADEDGIYEGEGFVGVLETLEDGSFGQGGEIWAKDATLESRRRVHVDQYGIEGDLEGEESGSVQIGGLETSEDRFGLSLTHRRQGTEQENILSYFDNTLRKNWAGPEHWKIRRRKDSDKQAVNPPRRREKELFEIDFSLPLDVVQSEIIYTLATSHSSISIPKAQQRSRTRNLLPDDKHFNSKELLGLFLKPRARLNSLKPISMRSNQSIRDREPEQAIDEAFWAAQGPYRDTNADEAPQRADYDANFFQDDPMFPVGLVDDDDEDFADAREAFSPANENQAEGPVTTDQAEKADDGQGTTFGSQLVTQSNRVRPEYVQYARVAKKVDVRRLKEEMWRGMDLTEVSASFVTNQVPNIFQPAPTLTEHSQMEPSKMKPDTLMFTSVINSLQNVYPRQAMQDISTSFCFICLLHLANEKGLRIDNENGLEELSIRRDQAATGLSAE